MIGRIARFVALITVVLAIFMGAAVALGFYYYNAPGSLKTEATIVLKRGTAFRNTVNILHDNHVIKYPSLFLLTGFVTEQFKYIKAGEYLFPAHISYREILEKLTKGDTVIRRVTIPEGLTTRQILAILDATNGLKKADTKLVRSERLVRSEGALLPETYHFMLGDTQQDIIKRMQKAMQETIHSLWVQRQPDLPFSTPEQAVTLASIVEKETGVASERSRVAAVFINRLRKGMPLQSDPTVIYAITQGKTDLDRSLTYNDLKVPSPYNTYMVQGIPPHPIAHPGKASIYAVLNPIKSKELYFVADGKGGHNFAETLHEHNRNVAAFRKQKR